MTQETIDVLFDKTVGNLFFKKGAGFLGTLLAKVKFKWDSTMPTAAISDSVLYWNPEFYITLCKDTRVTVLAHELWHNAFLHGLRLQGRCPELWNEAADHVINLMLEAHGYYMGGFPFLMDHRFTDMNTEQVYDILAKEREDGGQPLPNSLGGDILPIDPDQKSKAVANVVGAMATARITGGAGDIPGEVSLTMDSFLNPKLPWDTLLLNYMNELTSEEYSYARPNRRYTDPLLRGRSGRNGLEHLIYYLDISGSISDQEILRFNSEVKYIQEELTPERLTLVTFDTEIKDVMDFEKDDPFEKITVTGRGGTDLVEVFNHAIDQAPTAIVIFTDLHVSIPDNPEIPLLWICMNNPKAEVPFGTLIHMEAEAA